MKLYEVGTAVAVVFTLVSGLSITQAELDEIKNKDPRWKQQTVKKEEITPITHTRCDYVVTDGHLDKAVRSAKSGTICVVDVQSKTTRVLIKAFAPVHDSLKQSRAATLQ